MKKKNDGVKVVGRVSAVIAMVVLILAAIPVGACVSLSRERNNVTAEYYGSDDVYGVLDQVSMMVSEASNLVTVAEKYSETDLTLVDAVRTAQNAVKKAERPADKYAALNDLTTAVKAMYRQIKNIDMNEEDATYRESLMSNYHGICARATITRRLNRRHRHLRVTAEAPAACAIVFFFKGLAAFSGCGRYVPLFLHADGVLELQAPEYKPESGSEQRARRAVQSAARHSAAKYRFAERCARAAAEKSAAQAGYD